MLYTSHCNKGLRNKDSRDYEQALRAIVVFRQWRLQGVRRKHYGDKKEIQLKYNFTSQLPHVVDISFLLLSHELSLLYR